MPPVALWFHPSVVSARQTATFGRWLHCMCLQVALLHHGLMVWKAIAECSIKKFHVCRNQRVRRTCSCGRAYDTPAAHTVRTHQMTPPIICCTIDTSTLASIDLQVAEGTSPPARHSSPSLSLRHARRNVSCWISPGLTSSGPQPATPNTLAAIHRHTLTPRGRALTPCRSLWHLRRSR